jgi:hypothetical protein
VSPLAQLAALAMLVLGAFAFVILVWWIQRRSGHVGLLQIVVGIPGLLLGCWRLRSGLDLLGVIFVLQGIGFLYQYSWLRSRARSAGASGGS